MLYNLYYSTPCVTCYDNEGEGGSDGGQTDNADQRADQDGGDSGQGGQDGDRTFTPVGDRHSLHAGKLHGGNSTRSAGP